MAFVFRLEKVLKHRRRLVDLRSRDVAAAAARVAEIGRAVAERRDDQHRTAEHGATALRVEERRRCSDWIDHLETLVARLESQRAAAVDELAAAREILHQAWRDREVLEKLRRRREAEWQTEMARRERADLDEIGQQRALARSRQHRAGAQADSAGFAGTTMESGVA